MVSLYDRNRGERIRINWLDALSSACSCDLSQNMLLPLQETSYLKDRFFQRVKFGGELHNFWTVEKYPELLSFLVNIGKKTHGLEFVLFHSMDNCIGAIRMKSETIFENIERIWDITQEDLCLASEKIEDGLCLEFNYYNQLGNYEPNGVYELTSWGNLQ
jgi:hypothetical protein